ncbi:transglutaminase-like domain-containing protein [Carboxylicivirga linearis]|uniref:Transglutaminase domain-containing protein n=1 Tax=Carboxylicivirga linearis TaxID=1628157 RepID=A0ABS5K0U3_9BACT|nr:transglutaminase-like domain-containing protein [Carboxylicivirga linearis]MBS2100744.1 transglutaminase domain-containing protein [Carboxylicivirga linearis]
MNKSILFVLLAVLSFSCSSYDEELKKALDLSGENKAVLEKVINHYDGEQQEAAKFLIRYMPERDLKILDFEFLTENIDYAYIAREEFPWAKDLDKDIFFNEVLPYASLNERRDRWRPDFYTRFKKFVVDTKNMEEAIWAVNKHILKEVNVEYNTKRDKPDQSPYESMDINMASCSGLSILLVDAFRAVGIPARVAGTPNWYNNSGNHNWVEVYVNEGWHFTEYYPSGTLDEAWFLERAGKANDDDAYQWIYASSYKPTGLSFPLVWDENIKYVYATNETERYKKNYDEQNLGVVDGIPVRVVMLLGDQCSVSGNNRVRAEVQLTLDGDTIDSGFTSGSEDDMNRYLTFSLAKDKKYELKYIDSKGKSVTEPISPKAEEEEQIILSF